MNGTDGLVMRVRTFHNFGKDAPDANATFPASPEFIALWELVNKLAAERGYELRETSLHEDEVSFTLRKDYRSYSYMIDFPIALEDLKLAAVVIARDIDSLEESREQ